jgi:hypothetical protein
MPHVCVDKKLYLFLLQITQYGLKILHKFGLVAHKAVSLKKKKIGANATLMAIIYAGVI